MVESERTTETSIAGLWLGKHIPVAVSTQITIEELLEAAFSITSDLKLYKEGHQDHGRRMARGNSKLLQDSHLGSESAVVVGHLLSRRRLHFKTHT